MNNKRHKNRDGEDFRWTRPRRDLVELFSGEEHLSADEAYMRVKK